MNCKWCGTPNERQCSFCPKCGKPIRFIGYLIISLEKAIIPMSLLFIAYLFSNAQRDNMQEIEKIKWLAESYREFGSAYNKYRKSTVELELIFEEKDKTALPGNLRKAIIQLDESFNYIGSTLMPFDIMEKELISSEDRRIEKVWHNCFIIPYFGNEEGSPDPIDADWAKLMKAVKECGPDSCPIDIRERVVELSSKIYSGHCVGELKGEVIPLANFFDYTKTIITKAGESAYVGRRPIPKKK